MSRRSLVLSFALISGLFAATVRADSFGVNFTNTAIPTFLGNPSFTLGYSFRTNSAITVTELALFDSGQNGLLESHQIGIFNSGGTLLVSGTIAAGTVDPLDDKFRVINVSPTALTSGQTYYIGAVYGSGGEPILFPADVTGFNTPAAITFDQARFASGSSLAFPSGSGGTTPGYFGPDFKFTASVVPEPTAVILLATVVLVIGATGWRKTRRAN